MSAIAINVVAFQACWLAFVAGAARGAWWFGFVVLVPFAAWTLATSRVARADLALVATATVLGFVVDSAFAASGLLQYDAAVPWPTLAPAWIVGMWMAFALTLNHSLAFLHGRPFLAAALGAIAGPLAYWIAAHAWSAVAFAAPASTGVIALAVAWAIALPVLSGLAAWWTRAPAAMPAAVVAPR